MKKNFGIIITLLVVAVGAIILYFMISQQSSQQSTSTENMPDMSTASNTQSSTQSNSEDQTPATDVKTGTISMNIRDYAFQTKNLRVKVGSTVVWTNQDDVKHDVKSDDGSFTSSELLAKGQSYSYTFSKAGTYTYHCSPHPYMTGRVEVVE